MSVFKNLFILWSLFLFISSCNNNTNDFIEISREKYSSQLYGFWLGQSIANWTGLITEMDKIGNIGDIKTGSFYTREDWGSIDLRSIWEDQSIDKSNIRIDYSLRSEEEVWGSDDDTDIEYMYQFLLNYFNTSILSPSPVSYTHLRAHET